MNYTQNRVIMNFIAITTSFFTRGARLAMSPHVSSATVWPYQNVAKGQYQVVLHYYKFSRVVGQTGRKCGVGSQRTCSHFFRLIARILTIFDKKYRILTHRDKRESYLIVLQQNNV